MSVDSYFCFCCLSTEDLVHLFDKNPELNYVSLIKELFALRPSQDSSEDDNYLCMECVTKLKAYKEFKVQVFGSLKTLQTLGLINLRKKDGDLIIEKVSQSEQDEMQKTNIHTKQINLEDENITHPFLSDDSFNKRERDKTKDTTSKNNLKKELIGDVTSLPCISNKSYNIKKINAQSSTASNIKTAKTYWDLEEDMIKISHLARTNKNADTKEGDSHISKNYPYEVTEDLSCKLCKWTSVNMYGYHLHMNKHFPNHVCELCGKGFITEKRLDRHKYTHVKGTYICSVCGKTYDNYNTYIAHRTRSHAKTPAYSCKRCHAHFKSLEARNRHSVEEHQESPHYSCSQCRKTFVTSGLLNSHIKFKHLRIKRHFCTICDAGFYNKADLLEHSTCHTGQKPYSCDVCGNSYSRKKALKVHQQIHTNNKRFACNICDKRFLQKVTLQYHIKTHNSEAKIKENLVEKMK